MPIGSKRCRPTNTTARWPRPSRLSANSISPNSRAWRPHAASDATDLPATNAQDKPTSRSERFPDAWPHHRRYPARGSPPGAHRYPPRYAPPAARRARRYARVPPMDSGDEPLPMIKKDHADWGAFSAPIDNFNLSLGVDYFWTPIMAYFSAPIDTRSDEAGVHRRDLGLHEHGAQTRTLSARSKVARRHSPRPLQNHHACRWPAPFRPRGAKGLRPTDQRRLVRGMGGEMPRANALERRHRGHG